MNDNELLALMYDFYNRHTLKDQNKDIDYYINQIKEYDSSNILIVGGGTGRVAIPLSNYANVTAIDFDLERIKLMKEKCNRINAIYCDLCDYDDISHHDLIIFPYSTIQFGGNINKMKEILEKLGKLMNTSAICLLDFSESFNTKQEKNNELILKEYYEKVKSYIEVYYTAKKHKDFIEFLIRYNVLELNREVYEKEKYCLYNERILSDLLANSGLFLTKIDHGYKENVLPHKHIYHCRRKS